MPRRATTTTDRRASRRRKLSIAVAACVVGGGLQPVLAATGATSEANLLTRNQQTFEASPTGWTDGAVTKSSRSTQFAAEGRYSLKVVADGPKLDVTTAVHVTTLDGTGGVRVTAGESYSARVHVRPWRTATTHVTCHLQWFAPDGASLGDGPRSWQPEAAERWTTVSCAGVAPVSAAFAAVRVEFASVRRGDVHYVDEAWLLAGSTARPPDAATTTVPVPSPVPAPATTVATSTSAATVPATAPATVATTSSTTTLVLVPVPPTTVATTTTTLAPTTVPPTTVGSSTTMTTVAPASPTTTVAPLPATATAAAADALLQRLMLLSSSSPHEAPLYGIPTSWSWATNGRAGVWPPYVGRAGHNVWGQAVKADATTPTNVSLQVSLPEIHHHVNGTWQRVCTTQTAAAPGGSWHVTDTTVGYASTTRPIIRTFDNTTRISTVDLAPMAGTPPALWHWWYTWPRCPFEPDRGPVAMLTWMRLIGPDAATARISGAVAGDTYTELDGTAPNGDLGVPRHALITDQWQLFGYVTAPATAIAANPPPTPRPPS